MLKCVHDNIITKYIVDFENSKIIIYTTRENEEKINIIFEDVFTYLFENQQKNSIILDIEEKKIDEFIKDNNNILKNQKEFGWPIIYSNIDELKYFIEKNKYCCYALNSSCGMNGWIVSKRVSISG